MVPQCKAEYSQSRALPSDVQHGTKVFKEVYSDVMHGTAISSQTCLNYYAHLPISHQYSNHKERTLKGPTMLNKNE